MPGDHELTPTIVFDLDGTLVDTAPDLHAALNHVLDSIGRPRIELEQIRLVVGQGAAETIERGMKLSGRGPEPAEKPVLLKRFLCHYGNNIAAGSRPYDLIRDGLDRLSADGYRLAVCTNKTEIMARKLLDALRMDHYFHAILGGDTLSVKKPDPVHLTETIRRAGGHPAYAIMIGDSHADIAAAKAAMIPSIAVSFGYSPVPVETLCPDFVIDHYRDLLPAIERLLRRD